MTRRKRVEAPNRKGESLMKKKMTLALASSILTFTLSAFPHHAAASSSAPPPPPQPPASSGKHIMKVVIEMLEAPPVLWLL
jgi:hypothetical protein